MFELQQETMRFNVVLRRKFELLQEPMRFILVCRSNKFELQLSFQHILVCYAVLSSEVFSCASSILLGGMVLFCKKSLRIHAA